MPLSCDQSLKSFYKTCLEFGSYKVRIVFDRKYLAHKEPHRIFVTKCKTYS